MSDQSARQLTAFTLHRPGGYLPLLAHHPLISRATHLNHRNSRASRKILALMLDHNTFGRAPRYSCEKFVAMAGERDWAFPAAGDGNEAIACSKPSSY